MQKQTCGLQLFMTYQANSYVFAVYFNSMICANHKFADPKLQATTRLDNACMHKALMKGQYLQQVSQEMLLCLH